ncbi:MAG: FKBP-type peptidyl-prolyl cis-trans isomerase [Planctomycetota bacterium]
MPHRPDRRRLLPLRRTPGRLLLLGLLAALIAPAAWAQDGDHDHEHDHDAAPATQPAATQPAGEQPNLSELSYSMGYQLGAQLRRQGGSQLEPDRVADGVSDALAGTEPGIAPGRMAQYLILYQRGLLEAQGRAIEEQIELAKQAGDESRRAFLEERLRQTRQALSQQAAMIRNGQEGQRFLAENAEKDGVEVTDSGLQYTVESQGQGDAPVAGDTVAVHYRGTLIDGTEFDSSYARGEPATFALKTGPGGVIGGWVEGLQLVQPGGKIKLFVPPGLAYGAQGNGQIPPNATLVFEVELLEVNP